MAQPPAFPQRPLTVRERLVLFLAEGFGLGRIPVAPGTFGSLLGGFLACLLPLLGPLWLYLALTILGFFAAVYLGHAAERILGVEDPGSIVIDEIAAMPVAFLPCAFLAGGFAGTAPAAYLASAWWMVLISFAFFRLFDIWKPFPVYQSQSLPNGWGLVIDDFLAAGYAALASGLLVRAIQ